MKAAFLARRENLLAELQNVEEVLQSLAKLEEPDGPQRTETGRIKHGETEKAIMTFLTSIPGIPGSSLRDLCLNLGTSNTTTYNALKRLEREGGIRFLPLRGVWVATEVLKTEVSRKTP